MSKTFREKYRRLKKTYSSHKIDSLDKTLFDMGSTPNGLSVYFLQILMAQRDIYRNQLSIHGPEFKKNCT